MIQGTVNPRRQPIITLVVAGPNGNQEAFEFLVDSGFNGTLILPAAVVEGLGLAPLAEAANIHIADGNRVRVPIYEAQVIIDGQTHITRALASGRQPLAGMSLFVGYNININMVDGGGVAIKLLAPGAVP